MRNVRTRRRGLSVVLIVIVLVVLIAFVALAVDMGRVWLARAEMQTVADAAARAGALSLPVSNQNVFDNASDAALSNPVMDTEKVATQHLGERTNPGVELDTDSDIVFGIWKDNPAPGEDNFTELFDLSSTKRDERRSANAVLAWGRRIEDRDNSLPLIFGPVLGVFHSDIEKRAIATISGGPANFGFIGLDFVTGTGNGSIIDNATGNQSGGGVASNGNIDLGNADVVGDVRPGIGKSISQGPNSKITGWTANLDYTLKFPIIDSVPASLPTINNNNAITPTAAVTTKKGVISFSPNGNQNVSFPNNNGTTKTYWFNDWTQTGNGTITITGPTMVYVNGDFKMTGNGAVQIQGGPVQFIVNGNFNQGGGTILNNGSTADVYIAVTKANTAVTLHGNVASRAHVYTPLSDVTVTGTPGFTGWIIGKSLTFKGTSKLHYDQTRNDNTPFKIRLAQ